MHLCARACILVQCLCSASHGQCTYLPVVVLVLVSARVMYLLARGRTRTGTCCVVLRVGSTGVMYLCARACILVQCLCSASHGQCTYLPVVVLVLVSARVMYLLSRGRTRTGSFCAVFRLDSRAMYLCARACILVQCFVMGNPRHVRILVVLVSARVMYLLARGRTRTGTKIR